MKTTKLFFSLFFTTLLTFGLTVSLQSFLRAWTEPTAAPPGGAVLPLGGKWLENTSDPQEIYFINYVGIGTTDPEARLDVSGDIVSSGYVTLGETGTDREGAMRWNSVSKKVEVYDGTGWAEMTSAEPAIETSCLDHFLGGATTDGSYIIDPDGPGGDPEFDAVCDMTNGGYTLMDPNSSTYVYEGMDCNSSVTEMAGDGTMSVRVNFVAGDWLGCGIILLPKVDFNNIIVSDTSFQPNRPCAGGGNFPNAKVSVYQDAAGPRIPPTALLYPGYAYESNGSPTELYNKIQGAILDGTEEALSASKNTHYIHFGMRMFNDHSCLPQPVDGVSSVRVWVK